nr:MAG TPA: hypothetical protein [Caudoviricetes sp.]
MLTLIKTSLSVNCLTFYNPSLLSSKLIFLVLNLE